MSRTGSAKLGSWLVPLKSFPLQIMPMHLDLHPTNTALQIYPIHVKIYENLSHLDVIGWVTMRKLSGNHLFSIDFPCVSFGFPAILLKAMWPTAAGLGSAELGTLGLAQVLKLYVF